MSSLTVIIIFNGPTVNAQTPILRTKKTIQRKTMRNVAMTVNELIFNALIQIMHTNQRGRHNGIQ